MAAGIIFTITGIAAAFCKYTKKDILQQKSNNIMPRSKGCFAAAINIYGFVCLLTNIFIVYGMPRRDF